MVGPDDMPLLQSTIPGFTNHLPRCAPAHITRHQYGHGPVGSGVLVRLGGSRQTASCQEEGSVHLRLPNRYNEPSLYITAVSGWYTSALTKNELRPDRGAYRLAVTQVSLTHKIDWCTVACISSVPCVRLARAGGIH